MRFKKVQGPSDKTIIERFDPAVPAADRARAVAIESSTRIEKARRRGLEREIGRLTIKYGEGSPEVARARRKLEAQQGRALALGVELERVRIGPVRADEGSVIIHGRVLDRMRAGMPGLVVQIVDPNGRPIAKSKTDERGYFKLEITAGEGAGGVTPPTHPGAILVGARETAATTAATEGLRGKARLLVLDGERELHREDVRPISPGETRYQEIVVKSTR